MARFFQSFAQQRWMLVIPASLYPGLLVLLLPGLRIFPQSNGLLAIAEVFAPYLSLPLLLLLPLAFFSRTLLLRILLVLCLLIFCFSFLLPSLPFHASSNTTSRLVISVLSWNMEVGRIQDESLLQVLQEKHPAIAALEEVDANDIFTQSAVFRQLYSYQLARPAEGVPSNLALLSVYPILEYGTLKTSDGTWAEPQAQVLWARLNLGSDRQVVIIIGHPVTAINAIAGCYFCSDRRDAQLRSLNTFAQSFISRGEAVLLVGDMNVTDREPGYQSLTAGLQDSFRQVGSGSGHSWGFHRLNPYWPMLRLDYMLASAQLLPMTFNVDCTSRGSDHCVVWGQFGMQ